MSIEFMITLIFINEKKEVRIGLYPLACGGKESEWATTPGQRKKTPL
jgi:hypothetical protein